tara:strand:+ start:149390 stop:150373 length:984 start_codon:yes stop_codon:yes gene_type:complete
MSPRPHEFDLIASYFAPLATGEAGAFGLLDDAALLTPSAGKSLVLTMDAIVEGVHFLSDDPAADVAAKLLRVNLSDLAAKGASPRGYLLTCSWRADTPVEWIADFASGLAADQAQFGISLLGGDTVSTPGPLSFSLTAIGEVGQGGMLRRSGGQLGDDLYVTGTIGDGALGLLAAQGQLALTDADTDFLVSRYRRPEPRVVFGQKLQGIAHASLDISDGLMADLGHLCQQSDLGARIEIARLPLSDAARSALNGTPSLLETVVTGGDDYELLFAAPASAAQHIDSVAAQSSTRVTRIGRLVEPHENVLAVDALGAPLAFKHAGFRHF